MALWRAEGPTVTRHRRQQRPNTRYSALSPAYRVASSQSIFSPRAMCGSSSVSSIAYHAPLPPRACSNVWLQALCVYSETQYAACCPFLRCRSDTLRSERTLGRCTFHRLLEAKWFGSIRCVAVRTPWRRWTLLTPFAKPPTIPKSRIPSVPRRRKAR